MKNAVTTLMTFEVKQVPLFIQQHMMVALCAGCVCNIVLPSLPKVCSKSVFIAVGLLSASRNLPLSSVRLSGLTGVFSRGGGV